MPASIVVAVICSPFSVWCRAVAVAVAAVAVVERLASANHSRCDARPIPPFFGLLASSLPHRSHVAVRSA